MYTECSVLYTYVRVEYTQCTRTYDNRLFRNAPNIFPEIHRINQVIGEEGRTHSSRLHVCRVGGADPGSGFIHTLHVPHQSRHLCLDRVECGTVECETPRVDLTYIAAW